MKEIKIVSGVAEITNESTQIMTDNSDRVLKAIKDMAAVSKENS